VIKKITSNKEIMPLGKKNERALIGTINTDINPSI
jgi:hypothetical protein